MLIVSVQFYESPITSLLLRPACRQWRRLAQANESKKQPLGVVSDVDRASRCREVHRADINANSPSSMTGANSRAGLAHTPRAAAGPFFSTHDEPSPLAIPSTGQRADDRVWPLTIQTTTEERYRDPNVLHDCASMLADRGEHLCLQSIPTQWGCDFRALLGRDG